MRPRPLFLVPALVALPWGTLRGQSAAASYEDCYREVMALAPRADRMAPVTDLVLTRDAGRFTLSQGTMYFLTTVGGRTVGAVFTGSGTFSFAPPTTIEQDRLALFERARSLDAPFTELVLLFADGTAAELEAALQFTEGTRRPPGRLRDIVQVSLEFLADKDRQAFDVDLMAAFLNRDTSDLFYAHIDRERGGPLMFMVNPNDTEEISLSKRLPHTAWSLEPEVMSRFPRVGAARRPVEGPGPEHSGTGDRRVGSAATIRNYQITASLAQTGGGDLSFRAGARVEVATAAAIGPWVAFHMFSKLEVDSARWEDGTPATVFRAKDAAQLWIRLGRRSQAGEVHPLRLYYHGDLIDWIGDFFFIKTSIAWYPLPLEGRSYATFDLTFHTPSHYGIASVGERRESETSDRVRTTRWVTSAPIRNASFNIGLFDEHRVEESGVPPVTVMVSEQAHREMTQMFLQTGQTHLLQQRRMKETVGSDMLRSLKFFEHVYGEAPVRQFYAAEIPAFHGEAFPGLVNLSWATFQLTDQAGEDEVFRAHEVAHQWWGIGVDFDTYHDQWLSEGFSNFSGLWYLHAARRDNDKYFGILRRWRTAILAHREEPAPIWLGYRASSSKDYSGYQVLIYQKGAWVLHMLRIMMLELRTAKDDRFTAMMQDFYYTHRGRRASTADFQHVVERHIGTSMDWFFRQWVYGSQIPSYRVAYKSDRLADGQYRVTLRVQQANVPDDFQMYVPVTVDLRDNRQGRFRVRVAGPESEIVLPLLPAEPRGVVFNDLEGVLGEVRMVGW